jgi:hypothetical protein
MAAPLAVRGTAIRHRLRDTVAVELLPSPGHPPLC